MFDATLKSKVNREVGRLNGELCDLKEHEESLRIRKARLETEMRQAIAMRDMFELLGRLDRQPAPELSVVREPVMPEHPNGPQFVRPVPPQPPPAASLAAPSGSYLVTMTGRNCAADDVVSNTLREATTTPRPAASRARPARRLKRSIKPSGLPTTAKMTLTVLQEAGGWLRTSQITSEIRDRWWPGVSSRDIAPGAWRMAQEGKLERDEQHGYRLPAARPVGGHVVGNGATAQ